MPRINFRDPARIAGIERKWQNEINVRWRKFQTSVITRLHAANKFGMMINRVATPFAMDADQISLYMEFVEAEIARYLLGDSGPDNWMARYQSQSYLMGIKRIRGSYRAKGREIPESVAELFSRDSVAALPEYAFGVAAVAGGAMPTAPSLARRITPAHDEALRFLFTRAYDSLSGWTNKLASETRQLLMDAVKQGDGIDEIARHLKNRIGVSKSRAYLIARTEVVQANQRGAITEAEFLSEELGEELKLRWITQQDGRVRHLHAGWHGKVSTSEETYRMINKSPWNCRCSQEPVLPEDDNPEENARFMEQRKKLLELEKRG